MLTRPIHLERVDERFVLDLSLKLDSTSPLHIGAGSEGTNKVILRFRVNGKEIPIIPAESLKGTLRSLASSISKQLLPDNLAIKYHDKDKHVKIETIGKDEQRKIKELYFEKAKEVLEKIMPKDYIEEISTSDYLRLIEYYFALNCPVCRLFGAQGIAGKLTFSDGVPQTSPKLFTYTSTSINRKTRIVEKEKLFTITAVEPDKNLRFRFKIIGDNIYKGSEEAKLLSALLQWLLKFDIQVGGLKSYGYGRLSLDKNESTVKLLKFNANIQGTEDILNNVRALLLKEGYFQVMRVDEFVGWLK
jgi:CRISPR/Cas system CSM-associated protein Csm3 (group 7 of RAMP superfamily)